MKSILQSIKPQYCELIASGKKTIEVRKTRPKLDVPFKVYIYCTKSGHTLYYDIDHTKVNLYHAKAHSQFAVSRLLNGKIIGEYVCDEILEITEDSSIPLYFDNWSDITCLTDLEMREYANGKPLYLWHISDLKIYDKSKELSEFHKPCINPGMRICELCEFADFENTDVLFPRCINVLVHPPQSWCYVEEAV